VAKRRGNGEGSIYRRKDGLWVGQYQIQGPNGTKTKYIYSKTRKDAAAKLAKAIAERDSGIVFDSESLNLSDYLDRWLKSVEGTIRPGAFRRYEEASRIHVKPYLGSKKLNRINTLQLQSLYARKLDQGLSPRTVQIIIHATLHKALKQAVRWSLIPRNAAEFAAPPKTQRTEIKPLTEEQVKRVLNAVRGDQLEALYVLAITTGMRSGELLGLRWEDVDLEARTLQVRRTVFNGRIESPKTLKGKRSIRLTQISITVLRKHQRTGEWIFSTKVGTPVSAHNLHNHSWKPLLKKTTLPLNTRFHDLRHTCATLLLTKGVLPKIVQELLGHSSISITLDTYSHVLPNMQGEAVRAMEDIFEDD
jgi:integrase